MQWTCQRMWHRTWPSGPGRRVSSLPRHHRRRRRRRRRLCATRAEMGAQLGSSVAFGSGCGQTLPGVPRRAPLCSYVRRPSNGQRAVLAVVLITVRPKQLGVKVSVVVERGESCNMDLKEKNITIPFYVPRCRLSSDNSTGALGYLIPQLRADRKIKSRENAAAEARAAAGGVGGENPS